MPTDDGGGSEMVKLNVKVPERLLEELDALAEELEYPNRSEFVRAVLRDATEPVLTPDARERLAEGYKDLAAGRTTGHDAVRRRFGLDESGDDGD